MTSYSSRNSPPSVPPPPQRPARLLDQVRERIRHDYYSLKIEKSYVHYVHWARRLASALDALHNASGRRPICTEP